MDGINSINNMNTYNNSMQARSNSDPTEMTQDAFLKLFIESLKNQDPMEPMSQAEMMEQLTQLMMIENTTKMTQAVDDMLNDSRVNPISNYLDLMDKYVRVQNSEGEFEGKVVSVGMQGENVVFEMDDGKAYLASSIVGVANEPSVEEEDIESETDDESVDQSGEIEG